MINTELYHFGIKGMKWGVRRYQNKDGTLTKAGQKRYDTDMERNPLTKKEKSSGGRKVNADKWVTEDITNVKKLADASSNLTNQLKNVNNNRRSKAKERLDMSELSDKEMRDRINRAILERQYNDMFNAPETPRGKEIVGNILNDAGTVLGVTASALGVALAVRELSGK